MASRKRVLVDEGKRIGIRAHPGELSQAKPQQNSLLDPRVYSPLSIDLLGSSNLSPGKLFAELQKRRSCFRIPFYLSQGDEAFDGRLEGGHEYGSIEERVSECRLLDSDLDQTCI